MVMSQQAPLPLDFWCPAPSRPVVIICQNAKKQGNLPFPRDTFPGLLLPPPCAPPPSGQALSCTQHGSYHHRVGPVFTPNQSDCSKPRMDPGSLLPQDSIQVGIWPTGAIFSHACPGPILALDPLTGPPKTPSSFMPTSSGHACPLSVTFFSPLPVGIHLSITA